MNKVVVSGSRDRSMQYARARRLAAHILKALQIKRHILEVVFLENKEMRLLKREYFAKRKKRRRESRKTPANVLAFPEPKGLLLPFRFRRLLGEIYLNSDVIKEKPQDMASLLLHGILHLLGYTHEKKRDAYRMEALQGRLLRAMKKRHRP